MKNVLLDTNIVLSIVRAGNNQKIFNFIVPENCKIYISIVTEAEIFSLAVRQKWGTKKLNFLNGFLINLNIVEVNPLLVPTYAEIDAYSQRQNYNFQDYSFKTPRNMSKNDLWIASVAAILDLQLITTDADFDHLHNVFFEVRKIKAVEILPFF